MNEWESFLGTTFFVPCKNHPNFLYTSYCRLRGCPTCTQCPKSSQQVRVYRNMFRDVVRVPTKGYRKLETFRCNNNWVVYLRPLRDIGQYTEHAVRTCPCGRAINKNDAAYCSIQCIIVHENGIQLKTNRVNMNRPQKICIPYLKNSKSKPRLRRKPLKPVQSPCL